MAEINPNSEYVKYAQRWQRVRDIVDGEARLKEVDLSYIDTIKNTDNAYKARYLRLINPNDKSKYNKDRNASYINGARLYNTTVKTLSGLIGMLYRVEPVLPELPDSISYILDNVDGSGISLTQQSQSVSSDIIQIGRDGLLVDMPRNDDGSEITKSDVDNGFRATIQEYKAESVIEWQDSVINGAKKLSLVVLCEEIEQFTDELLINRETKVQYKIYRLDDGVTVQILTEGEEGFDKSEAVEVLGANKRKLSEIPFTFVGSKNNNAKVDSLPIEPVANVNLGHYQESANLASSSFQLSAAQPVISDDRYRQAADNAIKNGSALELGEDSAIILGTGGSFNLVSPSENPMSRGIQQDYSEQMIALGAQIITNGGQAETAEAARIKRASDVSDLEIISRNISTAYTQCLKWVCEFMGVEYNDDWKVELNTKFFDSEMTSQEIAELVKTWQAGAIPKSVLDYNLQKGKIIKADEDLEKMNMAIEEESTNNVDFDKDATDA